LSETEQLKKKPHIHPHRHCLYCGRMLEVKGRSYCLKCKPEYQKATSKVERSKKFQKVLLYYMIFLGVLIVVLFLYSSVSL